jgi:hypothetical protein
MLSLSPPTGDCDIVGHTSPWVAYDWHTVCAKPGSLSHIAEQFQPIGISKKN